MHELMYPVLQGFDSVQTGCDIEIGGTDQLFNCTMGRQLQESHGKISSDVHAFAERPGRKRKNEQITEQYRRAEKKPF